MKITFTNSKGVAKYVRTEGTSLVLTSEELEAQDFTVFTEDNEHITIQNYSYQFLAISEDRIHWSDSKVLIRHNFSHQSQQYFLESSDRGTFIMLGNLNEKLVLKSSKWGVIGCSFVVERL